MIINKKFVFSIVFYLVSIIGVYSLTDKVRNNENKNLYSQEVEILDRTKELTHYNEKNSVLLNDLKANVNHLSNFYKAVNADNNGELPLARKYIRLAYLELKPNDKNYYKVIKEYKTLLDEQAYLDNLKGS